mmetsp:Transcript_94761/g.192638  ORF Transcript_94761/g.192638 Transcript_94761/m.192638 type:complete len:405 (-) Transcript_94761:141-1355(-)
MATVLPTQSGFGGTPSAQQFFQQQAPTDKPPVGYHRVQDFQYIGQSEPYPSSARNGSAYQGASGAGEASGRQALGMSNNFCVVCGWLVCGALTLAVIVLSSLLLVKIIHTNGGNTDAHGCRTDEGYRFCASLNGCIRPWEQGWTERQAVFKCHAKGQHIVGGDQDEHGCVGSAGFQWCAKQHRCMRPWKHGIRSNEAFAEKCSVAPPVAPTHSTVEHRYMPACKVAEGYQWCALAHECLRPWEHGIKSNADFADKCKLPGPLPHGDEDDHGCKPSEGFRWCNGLHRCVRTWQAGITSEAMFLRKCDPLGHPAAGTPRATTHNCKSNDGFMWCQKMDHCMQPWQHGINSVESFIATCGKAAEVEKDNHGCVNSAGEQYCAKAQKCVRLWAVGATTDQQFNNVCRV